MTPLSAEVREWLKACNERFARFTGSKFSSHELPGGPPCEHKAAVRQATKRCKLCRKREVRLRQRFCPVCSKIQNREHKRMRRKRASDVEKLANSPVGAEALTKPEKQVGYHHPKTSILGSNFSTRQGSAQDVSEADGNLTTAGGHDERK